MKIYIMNNIWPRGPTCFLNRLNSKFNNFENIEVTRDKVDNQFPMAKEP